jgi:hypothetical protein
MADNILVFAAAPELTSVAAALVRRQRYVRALSIGLPRLVEGQ